MECDTPVKPSDHRTVMNEGWHCAGGEGVGHGQRPGTISISAGVVAVPMACMTAGARCTD